MRGRQGLPPISLHRIVGLFTQSAPPPGNKASVVLSPPPDNSIMQVNDSIGGLLRHHFLVAHAVYLHDRIIWRHFVFQGRTEEIEAWSDAQLLQAATLSQQAEERSFQGEQREKRKEAKKKRSLASVSMSLVLLHILLNSNGSIWLTKMNYGGV
eukprot:gene11949-8224_t